MSTCYVMYVMYVLCSLCVCVAVEKKKYMSMEIGQRDFQHNICLCMEVNITSCECALARHIHTVMHYMALQLHYSILILCAVCVLW